MNEELTNNLDAMLNKLGSEDDARLQAISKKEFEECVKESEKKLDDEYFKIEQIKIESLKDAMNEREIFI